MKKDILNIETVHQCNCCMGKKTLHPLVSVIDLSENNWKQYAVKFDFYTILLIEGQAQESMCGRKYYDYSNATAVFLSPGQSLRTDQNEMLFQKGRLLAFHPDLIHRTSLGDSIANYTFFFYHINEALHLSLREKNKIEECLDNIEEELRHAIDCYSKVLISRYIELLLDYCSRFYERQFITRDEIHKAILRKTDLLLDDYILSGRLKENALPSNEYFANILHLSSSYFADLLKFEKGKNIYEYIQLKRLEISKKMLSDKKNTATIVADRLGFSNVQDFSRLFKKLTGIAPNEYRLSQN